MEIRLRNAAGAAMLLSGVPAVAQPASAVRATTVADCASCPPPSLEVPGGPTTWFVAGFVAKLLLFLVAIEVGYTWLAVLAAINTVISIFYYVRLLAPAYFGELASPIRVLGRTAACATLASAGALIVTGIAAEPFMAAFQAAALLIR